MDNLTKIRMAWKYRRPLWKYRRLLRHRREIAAGMLGVAAVATAALIRRS